MIHIPVIVEGVGGGIGTLVAWESVKAIYRALKNDTEESRVSRLLKQQSDLLEEVQAERTDCTEKREKAEQRIGVLETKLEKIELDMRLYQRKLETAEEAARIAMVAQQGHEDARKLSDAKVAELTIQLRASKDYASRLYAEIRAIDPEHPILSPEAHSHSQQSISGAE